MASIQVLPKNLTNQIAAGEVIERPFSVVKELIENALDAQATEITIHIEQGGKEKIEVIDNGSGMNEEDAHLALQRFATSKIRSEEDLFHIHTFGFRGEALPSIASVSLFTLQTRLQNSMTGVKIKMRGGTVVSDTKIGMNPGTRVCVEHLFFNIPARMKYLKSDSTELQHIVQYVTEIAVIHYSIAFQLTHNGKDVFHLLPQKDLLGRIKELFGNTIEEQLLPVSFSHGSLQVTGYTNHPRFSKQNNKYEFLFINKRPVKNLPIHKAILQGYDRTIEKGSYPFFVLNLTIDPSHVDVNVHPRKLEVRFEDSQSIFYFFQSAIHHTLTQALLLKNKDDAEYPLPQNNNSEQISYSSKIHIGGKQLPRSPYVPVFINHQQMSFVQQNISYQEQETERIFSGEEASSHVPSIHSVLGQIHRSYIVFETKNGMGVADQHAVHEIILYEQIKKAHQTKQINVQQLLTPLVIEIPVARMVLYEEYKDLFTSLGFETTMIGKQSILLSTVPTELQEKDIVNIFLSLLDECNEFRHTSLETIQEKMYATMACRAAVKFGDVLTISEQQNLLDRLAQLDKGYSCPHGRPVIQEFSLESMLKWFKRP